jgi:hypothetical protein
MNSKKDMSEQNYVVPIINSVSKHEFDIYYQILIYVVYASIIKNYFIIASNGCKT